MLQSLADQGDEEAAAELAAAPALPAVLAFLWDYFEDLCSMRQSNGFGPLRWTRAAMVAEFATEGVVLSAWEVRALVHLDAAWMEAYAAQQPKPKG